jgi:hypothetical protein
MEAVGSLGVAEKRQELARLPPTRERRGVEVQVATMAT